MRFQQIYYVLDSDYRILWVGGDWDEFALANAGDAARSNEVLATSLFRHIVDEATAQAIRRLVSAVREMQSALRMDYRCDSPTLLRRFQMTIQPMKDGRVLLVHDLRDARTFDRPLGHWKYQAQAEDLKCSFCCSVRAPGGDWTPPEDLLGPHPGEVRYTVCPCCAVTVEDVVSSLLEKRDPKTSVTGGFGPEADPAS